MGIPVLILGESGSGKTSSLRNFTPDEIGIFNVASKPLPFKSDLRKVVLNNASYDTIIARLKSNKNNNVKTFVIDDAQYLMVFELFDNIQVKGFDKFSVLAFNYYKLIKTISEIGNDKIVYLLQHVETLDNGKVAPKTIGKMLNEKLCVEGLFSVVLMCKTDGKDHWIETQSDGFNPCKSPEGMFSETRIDNDLKYVDKKIREYWFD